MTIPASITRREREIITKLCLGWETKEIARELRISPRTVEDHRANILYKYKVRNLVEMMRAVYGLGECGIL